MILVWIGELISERDRQRRIIDYICRYCERVAAVIRAALVSYDPSVILPIPPLLFGYFDYRWRGFVNQGERKIRFHIPSACAYNPCYGGASLICLYARQPSRRYPDNFRDLHLLFPQFFAQIISIFSVDASIGLMNWSPVFE